MRVLVVGAGGFLGGAVCRRAGLLRTRLRGVTELLAS
ncbi:NAD(P)-dependent oxidoreductase [Micromonospora halophytica]|nr:NAD(P)-dependent oxidoreductase [Micromonospora halophytica]